MSEVQENAEIERPEARASLQDELAEVTALLRRHRLVEGLVHDQQEHLAGGQSRELTDSVVYRRNKTALQRKLDRLHPADIAFILEALPVEEREQLRAAMSFDDDMVGALMDFEDVTVRPDVSLEVVLRYLRRFFDEAEAVLDDLG